MTLSMHLKDNDHNYRKLLKETFIDLIVLVHLHLLIVYCSNEYSDCTLYGSSD